MADPWTSLDVNDTVSIDPTDLSALTTPLNSIDSHLDSKLINEQLLGTDNALITNTVIHGLNSGGGGTYVDVKVNPSGALTVEAQLVAGTASIGTLGANSGVDIGDVTINNGTGAAAVPIQDGGNSITVDGTVTVNLGGTGSLVDNAAFTDGTTRVVMGGYIFDEVAGTALTENDAAASRIDSKRAQVMVFEDATTRGQRATVSAAGALKVDGSAVTQPVSGTVELGTTSLNALETITVEDGGGSLTVDGTVAATQSGTWTVGLSAGTNNIGDVDVLSLPSLPAGTNNIGDVDVLSVPAPLNVVGGGTQAAALRVTIASDSTGVLSVDDNGGSLTVDGSLTAVTTVTTVSTVTNLSQLGGAAINMGAGTSATGTQRIVEAGAATATQTNPSLSTTSATLLAANTNRRGASVYNGSSIVVYIRLSSSAASSTVYSVMLNPGDYYEVPGNYNGAMTAILASSTTTLVQVTEIT